MQISIQLLLPLPSALIKNGITGVPLEALPGLRVYGFMGLWVFRGTPKSHGDVLSKLHPTSHLTKFNETLWEQLNLLIHYKPLIDWLIQLMYQIIN